MENGQFGDVFPIENRRIFQCHVSSQRGGKHDYPITPGVGMARSPKIAHHTWPSYNPFKLEYLNGWVQEPTGWWFVPNQRLDTIFIQVLRSWICRLCNGCPETIEAFFAIQAQFFQWSSDTAMFLGLKSSVTSLDMISSCSWMFLGVLRVETDFWLWCVCFLL